MNASPHARATEPTAQSGTVVAFGAREARRGNSQRSSKNNNAHRGSRSGGVRGESGESTRSAGLRSAASLAAATRSVDLESVGLGSTVGSHSESSVHGHLQGIHDRRSALLTLSVDHSVNGVGSYTRLMSVSSAMSVAELVEALLIAYAWPEPQPEEWTLRVKCHGVVSRYAPGAVATDLPARSIGTSVGEALSKGCVARLTVGSFSFLAHVTDSVAHDDAEATATLLNAEFLSDSDPDDTPLVDASALHPMGIPATVSPSEINIELAGEDTVQQVMAHVPPELKSLLHGGELYEFVPLLQALDLQRPANVSEHAAELLADAPVERTAIGRAAAWARIVALSTLVDAEEADDVSESFMRAVGYGRRDVPSDVLPAATEFEGGAIEDRALTASEIRELSRSTGRLLALAGADGWETKPGEPTPLMPKCSIVERLEMYRFLLQR